MEMQSPIPNIGIICLVNIRCYLLDVETLEEDFDPLLSLLPKSRQEKCLRFMRKKDQLLSLGGGLLIEAFVGRGPYIIGERGKPYKEGKPFFSLSHSGSFCLLAVAEKEVGADIEIIAEKKPGLVAYCFTEEEQKDIHVPADFFRLWCEKEALGKLIGFGLKEPKKTPVHRLTDEKVTFEGRDCYTRARLIEGYALVIAAYEPFELSFENVSLEEIANLLK